MSLPWKIDIFRKCRQYKLKSIPNPNRFLLKKGTFSGLKKFLAKKKYLKRIRNSVISDFLEFLVLVPSFVSFWTFVYYINLEITKLN